MTEAEWLSDLHPDEMMPLLGSVATPRKRRLIAAALCRSLWPLLEDARARAAVETVERYADDPASAPDLAAAHKSARDALDALYRPLIPSIVATGGTAPVPDALRARAGALEAVRAAASTAPDFDQACALCTWRAAVRHTPARSPAHAPHEAAVDYPAITAAHRNLIRCVAGNPFRPTAAASLGPARLPPAVVALARDIDATRAFDRMPELADALAAAAGRATADVIEHCRRPGPHARGCWVIDALLRKF